MATKEHNKLREMLIGYAAAHQHPFNVAVHLIGIPIIMLGVSIPLSWVQISIGPLTISLAHIAVLCLFLFYFTLDALFALVFLLMGMAIAELSAAIGPRSAATGAIAAGAFFGGYILQFVGHAVEKSMPVLVQHPIQANLAAPFFTVVEVFGLLGLRRKLFAEVKLAVHERRAQEATG